MRLSLLFTLFLISHASFGQVDTTKIKLYKDLVFSVTRSSGNSIGTAFVVGKNDEYYFLATAKHVVEGDQNFNLISLDGANYPATVVAEHPIHDFALLQLHSSVLKLSTDSTPFVTNLSVNDEVIFISIKDQGRILPSQKDGIVLRLTQDYITVKMSEVEYGHSGSPLLTSQGIAGIIIKNGRFVECLNILMVKELLDSWAKGWFTLLLYENELTRTALPKPSTMLGNTTKMLVPEFIKGNAECVNGIINLVDRNLETFWRCALGNRQSAIISFNYAGTVMVSQVKIHLSADPSVDLPYGKLILYYGEKRTAFSFDSVLSHKEREGEGFWYTYELKKPVLATDVYFRLDFTENFRTLAIFNEIQVYGITL